MDPEKLHIAIRLDVAHRPAQPTDITSVVGRISHRDGAWRAQIDVHGDGCIVGHIEQRDDPTPYGYVRLHAHATRREAEAWVHAALEQFAERGVAAFEARPDYAPVDRDEIERLLGLHRVGEPYYAQAQEAQRRYLQAAG